ncbi:sirohydrochlorin chelatase [Arthrobacter crystallopoietes]|uniref:Sirohydrochlorin ferrochelatase n=1 Tax=Crystallibacter crystallopoietes TaxID=37928 RepID=A0A1H1ERX6_9MICC|nr:CbiX/SirB N-terminal domain-containing protein [Arthrobacter crystallopoietes]AUI49811.1 cobalamin biosynthesis protein CbiX [Arthrobacter crystallopoietes]SDQ91259.1 Sirohydrochlorin ferrochelatase [Arthrobacter crystallopoietes]
MPPVLIACAHGTSNPAGRRAIDALRHEVARLRPGTEVLEAYVDVQEPALPDVVAALPAGRPVVVVPLLLSAGYHTSVDIRQTVASRPATCAAEPLGPDERLAALLQERLAESGAANDDAVVLAAAGSSLTAAAGAVAELAGMLRKLRSGPVTAGFGASAKPSVAEAVAAARQESATAGSAGVGSARVAVASYLLAPGFFHDKLADAGADIVTGPLLPHPVLAQLVLDRYDAAVAANFTRDSFITGSA